MILPPLALYVHLPWCERKCPYCDFNSHERERIPEGEYVAALLDDLDGELVGERRPLHSIFMGGGTPSLFSEDAIAKLLNGIRQRCALEPGVEITMEANPGSVERRRLKGYADAGVTRFSIGVQSFDGERLKALGRIHNDDDARAAIDAAKTSGARSFNLDLMHGLPGQDLAGGLGDLQQALQANAPHISWYQLTIEANTRFYSAPPQLPADDVLGQLEEEGIALLEAAGYERYEVSAWAKKGEACRHNLNYWRFGDYLAIGAGAHGKRSHANDRIQRYAKTRRPEDYLADGGRQPCQQRDLDETDRKGEFMLNALRLTGGFELTLFESRTGLSATTLEPALSELLAQELLEQQEQTIRPTALGRRFLDDVVSRFFA